MGVSKQTEGQAEPTTLRPWKQTPNGKENGPGKYVKAPQTLLKLDKSGGIKKSKKPVSALTIDANKAARLALATGVITKDELNRRTDRDLRTLYLRFKSSDTAPKSSQDIFALEKGIKDVRIPRQGKATGKHNIKYCFVEFSDESTCDSAKDKLAANPDFVVDYVGEKSKNRQANASAGITKNKMPINPVRLHVSGFGTKMTQDKLKALFPKSRAALIPKKVDHYGFVNFDNPADAKAAFDAANKLKVDTEDGTQSMTVVFARMEKHGKVEKAEDKVPKKRKKSEEAAEVKKADEAQVAWDGVKKAKKAETDETATEEAVEESADKDQAEEEEQSESDEDVENDEAEEEDENDEVENDKAEQKEPTNAENGESEDKKEVEEEVKEPVVEKDKVENKVEDKVDDKVEDKVGDKVGNKVEDKVGDKVEDKVDEKVEENDEEDSDDDVENDEVDNDDESD